MLNVKQGSCEMNTIFLNLMIRLDEEIEPRFTDYKADEGLFLQNANAAWRRSRRNGLNKTN